MLHQSPDLANSLLGVIQHFREEKVAIMGDISKMFYQVKVPQSPRNNPRLFWFKDSNISQAPREYRLTVHVFGATSSPSVANFALQQTVIDNNEFSDEAKNAVLENIYVDEHQAIQLLLKVKQLIFKGGFLMTQFVSTKFTENRLAADIKVTSLTNDSSDRALGLIWNVSRDTFFQSKL